MEERFPIPAGLSDCLQAEYGFALRDIAPAERGFYGETWKIRTHAGAYFAKLDRWVELCRRCGIEPAELAANDINGLEAALRAVPGAEGARVIIVRGECALLNMGGAVRTYETDVNRCRRCGACSKLGCPAISGRSPVIDAEKCVGCGMCASVCKCSAIRERA